MEIRLVTGADDLPGVDVLLAAAHAADGRDPLSDHKHLDLQRGLGTAIVIEEDGEVIALAQVSPKAPGAAVEMVVAPHRRQAGLVNRLLDAAREAAGSGPLQAWAFDPTQVAALEKRGLAPSREVVQLRGALPPDQPARLPPGFRLAAFRQGEDEDAWLAANNAAFAGHPENSGWDRATLEERFAQSWFDERGFLLAWEGEVLAGFCWTKMHNEAVGEIYVIAVSPGYQGRGLGRALTLEGLWYLHLERGARSGMIYADGDNVRGLALYRSLGFAVARTDYCFVI